MKTKTKEMQDVASYGIAKLKDGVGLNVTGADLHNELFNTDYFIIGFSDANKWLKEVDVFEAIGKIKEYEEDDFGELITDISDPEKVANMYAYIIGEELLSESKTLQNKWDNRLTEEDIEQIIKEIE